MHDTGVQFLSIDPGEMDTQMHADAMPLADRSVLARPEDVAECIVEIIRRSSDIQNGQRLLACSAGLMPEAVEVMR